jgi:hypothetical protein
LYLASFCTPSALIIRILLAPLLDAVIPACKITRIGLQPSLLTGLLPLCLATFVFTCLLFGSNPNIRNEIATAEHASLSLLLCIVHPLSYESCGQLCGCMWFVQAAAVLRKQQLRWEEVGYPNWGCFDYPLQLTPVSGDL